MAMAGGRIRRCFREPFPPTYRPRIDPTREFRDHEFIKIYHLPKDAVIELATGSPCLSVKRMHFLCRFY